MKPSKRLSKLEREVLLKAADLVASGYSIYSCVAIAHAFGDFRARALKEKYAAFYGQDCRLRWSELGMDLDQQLSQESRDIRVLLLLNYAKVG